MDLSNTDPQLACPLFNRLPPELRNRIFDLACAHYFTHEKPFNPESDYYRPCFRSRDRKISLTLPRTCKCVYSETKHLPLSNYEEVIWLYNGPRYAAGGFENARPHGLANLHIFVQQCYLEGRLARSNPLTGMPAPLSHVKHFKITMRFTDWWSWNTRDPQKS